MKWTIPCDRKWPSVETGSPPLLRGRGWQGSRPCPSTWASATHAGPRLGPRLAPTAAGLGGERGTGRPPCLLTQPQKVRRGMPSPHQSRGAAPAPSWEARNKLLAGGRQGPLGSQPAGGGSASQANRNLGNQPSHTSIKQPRNDPQQSVGNARARPPAQGFSLPPANADLGSCPRPQDAGSSLPPHAVPADRGARARAAFRFPGRSWCRLRPDSGSCSRASARASVGGAVRVGLGTLIAAGHTSREVETSESASCP